MSGIDNLLKSFGIVYGVPILSGIGGAIAGYSYAAGIGLKPEGLEKILVFAGPIGTAATYGAWNKNERFDSAVGGSLLGTITMGVGYGIGLGIGKLLN